MKKKSVNFENLIWRNIGKESTYKNFFSEIYKIYAYPDWWTNFDWTDPLESEYLYIQIMTVATSKTFFLLSCTELFFCL